ncbi:MAG: zf-HC2 domain-containing protein [Bacteroidota bacterium]
MDESSGFHIADDQDRLARFVLGTLSDADRRSAEEHLAGCDACAAAVRRERVLAAGIRRLGRDLLKETIRRQTSYQKAMEIPWLRVAGAAAVLVVLVGVGVIARWFVTKPEAEQVTSDRTEQAPTAVGEQPSIGPADLRSESAGKESLPSSSARREADAAFRPLEKGAEDRQAFRAKSETAPTSGVAAAGNLTSETGKYTDKLKAAETPLHVPSVFWTEGNVISAVEESKRDVGRDEAESRALMMRKDVAQEGAAAPKPQRFAAKESAALYQIQQRPAAALPRERQAMQQFSNSVQTKIEQRGNVTTLTLYLDSLANESDLRKANVETLSDDSVVVNLGKQKIGYRLPSQKQEKRDESRE